MKSRYLWLLIEKTPKERDGKAETWGHKWWSRLSHSDVFILHVFAAAKASEAPERESSFLSRLAGGKWDSNLNRLEVEGNTVSH